MKGLTGKVAVVTGGSSGIGQAIAIRLGEEGVDVAINYVGRPEGAEETKDAIEHGVDICMKQMAAAGTHPILVAADVSQEDQVDAMYRQVLEQYGRVDILINNAGIQIAEDTDKLAVADFDKVLAVNLRGAFLCAQRRPAPLPRLRPRRLHRQRLQRAPGHPEAAVRRLLGVQGRDAEPHPHPGAGVRGARDPGERHRPRRDRDTRSTGPGSTTRSSGRRSRATSRCGARATRRRWRPPPPSSARTRPPTSPGRRSSSTAGSRSTRRSRRPGRASERRDARGQRPQRPAGRHRLVAVPLRRRRRGRRAERDRPRPRCSTPSGWCGAAGCSTSPTCCTPTSRPSPAAPSGSTSPPTRTTSTGAAPTRAPRAGDATTSTGWWSRSPPPSRWAPTWTGSTTCRWGTAPTTGTGSPTSPRSTAPTSSASTRCRRS